MTPTINRHEYPRRTSYIITKYTVKEGAFRDGIKNIGAGGLFVRRSRKVSQEQSIVLEFSLFHFDNTARVTGTVTRCHADGLAVLFDTPLPDLVCEDVDIPEIVHENDR